MHFDTSRGSILISSHKIITHDLTRDGLIDLGFSLNREFSMPNGWYHCSTEPRSFAGNRAAFVFHFKETTLESVSFTFADEDNRDENTATDPYEFAKAQAPRFYERYANFLEKELGVPTSKDSTHMRLNYAYTWGSVSIAYDYHNFYCEIFMRWLT